MGFFDSIFNKKIKKPYSTMDELLRRAKDAKKIIPVGGGIDLNMGNYIMDVSHLILDNERVITLSKKDEPTTYVILNNSVSLAINDRITKTNLTLDDYDARGFSEVIGSAIRGYEKANKQTNIKYAGHDNFNIKYDNFCKIVDEICHKNKSNFLLFAGDSDVEIYIGRVPKTDKKYGGHMMMEFTSKDGTKICYVIKNYIVECTHLSNGVKIDETLEEAKKSFDVLLNIYIPILEKQL